LGKKFGALLQQKYKPCTHSVAVNCTLLSSVTTYLRSYLIYTTLHYYTNYDIQFHSPKEHSETAGNRTRVVDFGAC